MIDLNLYNKYGTKIQILEANQTGYGMLVEQDAGFITKSLNTGLITESFKIEDLDPYKPIFINCILQKWGVENRNGRVYPKDVLIPQVNNYQRIIDENSSFNEVNHPSSQNIDLHNISHSITKMWWGTGENENILFGQLELFVSPGFIKYGVLSAPADIVMLLMMRNKKIGISSRGIGSLKQINGKNIVQPDFELVAFDLVATPSTFGAYLFPNSNEMNIGESVLKHENNIVTVNNNSINDKKLAILNKFLGK